MKNRDKRLPLEDKVGDVVPVWVEDTHCWERAVLTAVHAAGKGFEYQICDRRFGL